MNLDPASSNEELVIQLNFSYEKRITSQLELTPFFSSQTLIYWIMESEVLN